MKKNQGYLMVALGDEEGMTEDQTVNEIKNYIRRIRSYRETHGLNTPKETLQYMLAPPVKDGWYGPVIIMTGMDLEKHNPGKLWKKGPAIVSHIDTNKKPPEILAKALLMSRMTRERWTCSRGLKANYLKRVLKCMEKGYDGPSYSAASLIFFAGEQAEVTG